MKKQTLLLAIALVLGASNVFGQASSQLNFGGLGTGLYASYDIPVVTDISIAPLVRTNWDFNYLVVAVKGDYYFDNVFGLPPAWDVYLGANVGFIIINKNTSSNLDAGAQVGGRWHWSDKWAINVEFGGGTNINGGVGVTMQL